MTVARCEEALLQQSGSVSPAEPVAEAVLAELSELALATDSLPTRSQRLFQQLRKMVGQPRLVTCLQGIQTLAQRGEPAGARLLAAFLDANTPATVLVPRVHRFSSIRRLLAKLSDGVRPDEAVKDWQSRLAICVGKAEAMVSSEPRQHNGSGTNPDNEGFFPLLRALLQQLLRTCRQEISLSDEESAMLAELIRLEVDAYQERISQLAGEIDPFRVTAITRVLPLLSQADATIRDLRQLIAWIEEGDFETAFRLPVPRSHDVLDEKERPRFEQEVSKAEVLAPLAALQQGLRENPLPVPLLAGKLTRLLVLGRQLVVAGRRQSDLDLITAIRLIQQYDHGGELRLPMSAELARQINSWLITQRTEGGSATWLLDGLEVKQDELILRNPDLGMSDRVWRHDLPTLAELVALVEQGRRSAAEDGQSDDDEEQQQDLTLAAIKKLVLNNIDSASIVLGFLRNPKIVAIPGLVATVATRARTARLVEVIATDRRLYTGHANQDVPLACLRSPCNVPVKTLRKFVQVKYVSKVDLAALARNKDAIRQEVVAEVKQYLDSLV